MIVGEILKLLRREKMINIPKEQFKEDYKYKLENKGTE